MKAKLAIFTNTRKTQEKQPDYTGSGETENGEKLRVSAWLATSKAGQRYISLIVETDVPRDGAPAEGGATAAAIDALSVPPAASAAAQPSLPRPTSPRHANPPPRDDSCVDDAGPDDIPF